MWNGENAAKFRELIAPAAGPVFEQPGKLRPIGRFKSKIFARDHGTRIGQCAPRHAHVILQLRRRIGVDQQREVMIAERESVGFEIVERVREFVDLRGGRILSRDQLVLLARQDRLGVGLRQKREGLRDDELKRRGKQRVQQARPGGRRIFLDPNMPANRDPPAPRISRASRPKMTRFE